MWVWGRSSPRATSELLLCGPTVDTPTPLDLPTSLSPGFPGVCKGPGGRAQCREATKRGLGPRGPCPWAKRSAFTQGGNGPTPDGEEPQYHHGGHAAGSPARGTPPLWTSPKQGSGPRGGTLLCTAAVSWGHADSLRVGLRCVAPPGRSHSTPTATEFFMSATAEVNSLKCSSGQ